MLRSVIQYRPDACLDIIDSLCANINNRSVVKITLSELFERKYSSLYKAIHQFCFTHNISFANIADFCLYLEMPTKFQIILIDVTPYKSNSKKLTDKQKVYNASSNSDKPVCNGHNYSIVSVPVIGKNDHDASWNPPISVARVPSDINTAEFGMKQVSALLNDDSIRSIDKDNPISMADAGYNTPKAILAVSSDLEKNLTHIVRCRGGRVCFKTVNTKLNKPGRPMIYGTKIKLNSDADKMLSPDLFFKRNDIKSNGKDVVVSVSVWGGIVFRSQKNFEAHRYPFSLIRISVTTPDGKKVFARPLWLCIYGKNRDNIVFSLADKVYQVRFLIEVLFKYSKQNFLFNRFQTPITANAENMVVLIFLSYLQCFICRKEADSFFYPWEYSKKNKPNDRVKSVSEVQQYFPAIIKTLKISKNQPKVRGKSKGRSVGQTIKKRKNSKVIIKKVQNNLESENAFCNLQPGIFEKLDEQICKNGNSKKTKCQEQKITMEFRKETVFSDSSVNIAPIVNKHKPKSSYKNSRAPPG